MKNILLCLILFFCALKVNTQTCDEMIDYVKSKSYVTTYYSYSSSAISQVTFYEVNDNNYNTYYFAVVRFTSSYTNYIYQVSSNTKLNYLRNYLDSAGRAFWKFIQPYNENLNCGVNLN